MTKWEKISLVVLRLSMGWVYLYAGLSKVLNPDWTAVGYLKAAKTFPGLYQWFASAQNIDWVNFLNKWGLTLIGAALILGVAVRFASYMGALITMLYYFPILVFPKAGANSYIVDDHVIYALIFVLLAAFGAGRVWGLDSWLERSNLIQKAPWLRKLLG
ncbi:DoxX family membrane protein [Candidatus Saccharibacteria bacterium]|nr:DoxX family membrane protein [Candidatus Saccharibacteria bacterium]